MFPKTAKTVLPLLLMLSFILANVIKLGGTAAYLVPPVVWIAMFIISYPNIRASIFSSKKLVPLVIIIATISIFIRNFLGLAVGFGLSPYVMSIYGLLFNMYFFLTKTLGFEYARTFIVQKTSKTVQSFTSLLGISILFTLLNVNMARISYITGGLELIKYLSSELLPVFALNLFLTYLVFWGGAACSIIFIIISKGYYYLAPIIPNLPWTIESIVSVLIPLIGFIVISNSGIFAVYVTGKKERIGLKNVVQIFSPLIILLITTGILGLRPLTIVSGSMQPTLNVGDIVFIAKTPISELSEGDIIAYLGEQGVIVHRIHEIIKHESKNFILTKGDANKEPDAVPVDEKSIIGKVVLTVPKIGMLQLYIRDLFLRISNKVQEILSYISVMLTYILVIKY
ncbi:MAG: signal peptidase I [Thermoprotei archaeon]|nr:MAG: signal peptidase I [Thermoprotei archaeon]